MSIYVYYITLNNICIKKIYMILLQRVNIRSKRWIMKKQKNDLIIIIILILVALISWLVIGKLYYSTGAYAEIVLDGNVEKTLSLNQNTEYKIETKDSINVIEIKDGKVIMKSADCPDKLCVKQGTISKNGQSIICLPNKTVVRIVSDLDSNVDAHTN